jgi:cell division protein FtsW
LPFFIFLLVLSAFLVPQPDIGTLGVIVMALLAAYLVAGVRLYHFALILLVLVVGFAGFIIAEPYRLSRVQVLLTPVSDPSAEAYQLNQSILAIGGGGLFGRGFAQSEQKASFLPEPFGDSIFAVVGEEFGFMGSLFLVVAFTFFAWRGFKIAAGAPDNFSRVLAAGITTFIVAQAFVNMGAISGIVPLTGIPLPFISYGGSSLIMVMASSGILLNISKYSK